METLNLQPRGKDWAAALSAIKEGDCLEVNEPYKAIYRNVYFYNKRTGSRLKAIRTRTGGQIVFSKLKP